VVNYITLVGSLYIISGLKKETLWFDKSYSTMIIKHPLPDIVKITASDSHPPLYYVILSLYSKIAGESPFMLRFFSFLGVLGLAILGLISIRKKARQRNSFVLYLSFVFVFGLR